MAQELPQGYFRVPMEGEMALSATFGELRMNHFHGGIDMRTGGVTGKPVYAAADGYVARVSVSPWGGGKILYIKHPNGYTSVYMHLDGFCGEIAKRVLEEQYSQQSYSISKEFPAGLLKVKKGQQVAVSGNTGGSGGPHLHFELRRATASDQHTGARTFNPLHAGLPYRDGIKPTLRGIRIYPVGGQPFALGKENTASVGSPFYLGIYATDAAEGSTARNGVDRIEVSVDGTLAFAYTTEAYGLDSTRVVNALIDYRHYRRTGEAYLLTRALPGAEGEWIAVRQGDGIFRFAAGTEHRIEVRAYDVADNCTKRSFTVRCTGTYTPPRAATEIDYTRPYRLERQTFSIDMPPHCLYADERLQTTVEADTAYRSAVLTVEPTLNDIPPHRSFTLSLRSRGNRDAERLVLVRLDGKRTSAYPTRHEGAWHSAEVRDFGRFALLADTEAPKIRPLNFTDGGKLKTNTLRIKISDNLSGIETYNCYLNGQWILAEYDGKSATLTIAAAGKLRAGQNRLRVEVVDGVGNSTDVTFLIRN